MSQLRFGLACRSSSLLFPPNFGSAGVSTRSEIASRSPLTIEKQGQMTDQCIRVGIVGENPTPIWGMSAAESDSVASSAKAGFKMATDAEPGPLLLAGTGFAFDPPLLGFSRAAARDGAGSATGRLCSPMPLPPNRRRPCARRAMLHGARSPPTPGCNRSCMTTASPCTMTRCASASIRSVMPLVPSTVAAIERARLLQRL